MIVVQEAVIDAVREIASLARGTLLREGTHLPTVILHAPGAMIPLVLPFKTGAQKRAMAAYAREQALEHAAYAVTTVTCGRVIDQRTGDEEETLVLVTAIQGGSPHYYSQRCIRTPDRRVVAFDEPVEGDAAAMPGQMMIFPDWSRELKH